MIINIWKNTKAVCDCHENTPEMVLTQITPRMLQYKCPVEGCTNCMRVEEFNSAIDKIEATLDDAMTNGQDLDITNYKFKVKKINFKVHCYKKDKIVLGMYNKAEAGKGAYADEQK